MKKRYFVINTVLFIPLLILNFFAYGIKGDIDMIEEWTLQAKDFFKKD